MAVPVMSYEEFQRYAAQQQAPQQNLPPVPPPVGPPSLYQPPSLGSDSYGSAQPMPYNPNASPTESWQVAPMPSNVATPIDPYKGVPLDQIPPMQGWRRV